MPIGVIDGRGVDGEDKVITTEGSGTTTNRGKKPEANSGETGRYHNNRFMISIFRQTPEPFWTPTPSRIG